MTNIAVMGSTGSIGTQTLDIISRHPQKFRASVLTAGRNVELLAKQALEFRPDMAVIADETLLPRLEELLEGSEIICRGGSEAIAKAAVGNKVDKVMAALVGYSGLLPTINAIKAGKDILLANKETLVVGGSIVCPLAKEYGVKIIPVDSEHSAIFQALRGEKTSQARKIFLTASGGPFRNFTKEQIADVTPEMALKHPNWNMGAKVTIDSASMMNKGFEMIEAHWLFDCPPSKIEILVHPQSIVHSMVEFIDGSVKAQLGPTDMRLPISYAMGYPERLDEPDFALNLPQFASLTFESPDFEKFPLLRYAFEAIEKGGNAPCIFNAANEVAVRAFLNHRISFPTMGTIARKALDNIPFMETPTLEDLINTHRITTEFAESLCRQS
ncbi:MAG: 1-deoxy-D-xylulose-5-phosphate reductoisomerase [Muribaculaceae bacterium]|nr:1-deoxy-D-xylulose-5-phosphate reductoisomerase [Muribaculaceae bacterium]